MKSLREYIIQEKLHLNSDIKVKKDTIKIPVCKDSDIDGMDPDDIWKEIKIPDGKWVVYLDQYRGDQYHFSDFIDFCGQLVWCQSDYEGIDPLKKIVLAGDNFDEVFNDYCKLIGYPINDIKGMKEDEAEDFLDNYEGDIKATCDSDTFFRKVINGEWGGQDVQLYTDEEIEKAYDDFPHWFFKNR